MLHYIDVHSVHVCSVVEVRGNGLSAEIHTKSSVASERHLVMLLLRSRKIALCRLTRTKPSHERVHDIAKHFSYVAE